MYLIIFLFLNRSLQEGQDIFGVDFDYDEFEKYGEEDYEDEEDDDEYLEYDEEEDGTIKKISTVIFCQTGSQAVDPLVGTQLAHL